MNQRFNFPLIRSSGTLNCELAFTFSRLPDHPWRSSTSVEEQKFVLYLRRIPGLQWRYAISTTGENVKLPRSEVLDDVLDMMLSRIDFRFLVSKIHASDNWQNFFNIAVLRIVSTTLNVPFLSFAGGYWDHLDSVGFSLMFTEVHKY